MNKKEISEIKKQLTPENCALTRLCACYVDGEKNKKTEMKEAFLSQSEEECFKYFEIFRKSLSGTVGKNLINLEFPLDAELEGGAQEFLLRLRDSRLKDDELLEEFYDKVIESFEYGENYLILLVHGAYDIPGKASDNEEMFDASDEVYESGLPGSEHGSPQHALLLQEPGGAAGGLRAGTFRLRHAPVRRGSEGDV